MPRHQQVVRQWQLLRRLENDPGGVSPSELSAGDLARQRAIYRDLEALQQAGFPLYADETERGRRWRLVDGARTPRSLPLLASEVLALRCARSALDSLEGTPYHEALRSLTDKLDAHLGPELRAFAAQMDEAFVGDRFGHPDYEQLHGVLDVLGQARAEHLSVDITYQGQKGNAANRRVDPYNIWLHRNVPYLVAWCHSRRAVRTFSVARIQAAVVSTETFTPQAGYDFDAFVRERFRIWGEGKRFDVAIWFSAEAALYIQERTWHPSQQIEPAQDGAVILRMQTDGLRELASWVLGFGPRARALQPPELVTSVTRQLQAAAELYGDRK